MVRSRQRTRRLQPASRTRASAGAGFREEGRGPAVNSRPQAAPRQMVTEGREPRDPVSGAGRPKDGRTGSGEAPTQQSAGQRAEGGTCATEGRNAATAVLATGENGAEAG